MQEVSCYQAMRLRGPDASIRKTLIDTIRSGGYLSIDGRPALPAAYVPPVALAELKRRVLAAATPRDEKGASLAPVITAHGMGGVGKTTTGSSAHCSVGGALI